MTVIIPLDIVTVYLLCSNKVYNSLCYSDISVEVSVGVGSIMAAGSVGSGSVTTG